MRIRILKYNDKVLRVFCARLFEINKILHGETQRYHGVTQRHFTVGSFTLIFILLHQKMINRQNHHEKEHVDIQAEE